jgi:hypothetical protein
MTQQADNAETADRLSGRRASMMIGLAFIFLSQQAAFFSRPETGRVVDQVRAGAWVLLAAALLAVVLTGGFWLRPRAVRALMEDELTRANRASAVRFAFAATMIAAMALYAALPFLALDSRATIHVLVSIGLVTALIRFAVLERRALG